MNTSVLEKPLQTQQSDNSFDDPCTITGKAILALQAQKKKLDLEIKNLNYELGETIFTKRKELAKGCKKKESDRGIKNWIEREISYGQIRQRIPFIGLKIR